MLTAPLARAQSLVGRFYAQKSTYLLGEPVWFVFEVTNTGTTPLDFEYSNPYGVCAFMGGYSFDLPGVMTVGRWRCGYGGSRAGGGPKPLAPGATYAQRLLLNQRFRIDHTGEYHVIARRELRFSDRVDKNGLLVAPHSRLFKSDFEIAVVQGEQEQVRRAFEPSLRNLNSRDFDLRVEAVETITAIAPPFLERTLIALATGEDSFAQSRAVPALGRLNTAESRRVLANLIGDRQDYYIWQAIDALVQTGDRSYLPLLERLAREPKWQNLAIPALGELGGRESIPFLVPLIRCPLGPPDEPPVQQLAIRGLANTGSREAVPYLIQALRDPLVHRDAVNGLAQLTHLAIHQGRSRKWLYTDDDKIAKRMAERWQRWWKSAGQRASLYGPGDCTSSPAELPE